MHNKKQKKRLKKFLYIKEAVMLTLAGLSLIFLLLEHVEKLTEPQLIAVEVFEIVVGLLFLTEFVFEMYHAKDRWLYFKRHWFYLFAAIPLPKTTFELMRAIRLLRLLRLFKIFAHLGYEHNTYLFATKGR